MNSVAWILFGCSTLSKYIFGCSALSKYFLCPLSGSDTVQCSAHIAQQERQRFEIYICLNQSECTARKAWSRYCATTQKITSDTALLRVSWMNWGIMHSCNSPLLDYLRLCVRGFKTTLDYIGLRVHSCQTTLVYFGLHVHGCSKNNLEGN